MQLNHTHFVGYYIQVLSKLLTQKHDAMLAQIGLTYAQFRILNCLWQRDEVTQNDIIHETFIKPASLTGLLLVLERKGYIDRKACEKDKRAKRVCLTQKGRDLQLASHEIILSLERNLMQCIPGDCQGVMSACLGEVISNIKASNLPDLPDSARKIAQKTTGVTKS